MDDAEHHGVPNGIADSYDILTLQSSSTNLRLDTLKKIQHHIKHAGPLPLSPLPALLSTYVRYEDRRSRRAVQECLRLYVQCDTDSCREAIELIVRTLSQECGKPVIAASSAYVLLEWCALLQEHLSDGAISSHSVLLPLSTAAAAALEKCTDRHVRRSIRKSAQCTAARGLRRILCSPSSGRDPITALLRHLTTGPSAAARNIPYLDLIAGPLVNIRAGLDEHTRELREFVEFSVSDILAFYCKHVIGSKIPVQPHIAGGLREFFGYFVRGKDFLTEIAPSLEKAILRSPELILQGTIPSLVFSLPESIDPSDAVHEKLLQPLLASFKSTNAAIKDGASQALSALLGRCQQETTLLKVTGVILKEVKAAKAADLRGLLAGSLGHIVPQTSVSDSIVTDLTTIMSKETNETALKAGVEAMSTHLVCLLARSQPVQQTIFSVYSKGGSEKRPLFRKTWLLAMASVIRALPPTSADVAARQFIGSALRQLRDAYHEIAPNAMPAVQNSTVCIALAFLAVINSPAVQTADQPSLQVDKTIEHPLATTPKVSFLINPKVYTRLETLDDLRWALSALLSVIPDLEATDQEAQKAWAQAILYLSISPNVQPAIRQEAHVALAQAHMRAPQIVGGSLILGLWKWLQSLNASEKESPAILSKAEPATLKRVLKAILPSKQAWETKKLDFPEQVMKNQLASMLVLCQPCLIPGVEWIALCLESGVDPGELVNASHTQMLAEVISRYDEGATLSLANVELAATSAAATMAFVAPEAAIPALKVQTARDLSSEKLENLGPTEAAISRTPEGIAFIDVLDQRTNVVEEKNRKDYDVLKWEEEVRAQAAKRRGQQKKLTPDQQAKVDAQIALETSIRRQVFEVTTQLRRGAGIIQALANGPPTDPTRWMSSSVSLLLNSLQAGAALFANEDIIASYRACSSQVATRLGSLRQSIGVATLRADGGAHLDPAFEAEPLGELVTRVLYRLRFAAEQRPFDTASLAYMLPLIFLVLDRDAVGFPAGEDADAQILLALEFLTYQMPVCSDTNLPRVQILRRLISAMQRHTQHYRLLKDAILDFCRSISGNLNESERNVLLAGVTVAEVGVRSAVLQAIHSEIDLTELDFSEQIWLACHDEDEENAETALAIWEENGFEVEEAMLFALPGYLAATSRASRVTAAKAVAQAVSVIPAHFNDLLSRLQETYRQEAQPVVPKRDKFGMVQKTDLSDHWQHRSGQAMAFKYLVPVFPQASILPHVKFLVQDGPLSDRNATVRDEMVDAGRDLVAARGQECLEPLMDFFEGILSSPDKGTQEGDWVNEAVIVLYGSQARHLDAGDERIRKVISKLISTLSTPSESVQAAVAGCMPPLIQLVTDEVGSYVAQLLDQLFQAKQYATRRGAAYGLAGVIKGKGIAALRQYRVMSSLRAAADNKKSMEHRQGALFAYELLSLILGRTFEPYIIEVLPQLLACFGDPNAAVREACLDAAKTCFASLSSFGVHQVLPRLLEGLDETQWRSKKGACELLGAMAYLDPQQLASSLPEIIPPLTAVLTDSHKEVRAAANSSLKRFGEVISNPEVKSLVDVLLKALSDPTKYTEDALDGLIKVSFVHYLDAPSLALVVRILQRGLADRSSTKRKAAQIIGSLAHLTERRDLISHLPILVSGLRVAAVDPVPATRATASKALGSLMEKLGEDALPDLIPSLMSSLRTDTGAGDRLGSAQALSEVLAGLGTGRLEETLPTILQNVSSTKATVREGFMTLFIFLPACFGNSFATYLNQIIPSILGGLADELEAIRDIALRAGRLLVKNFATKAIDLLLPELQRGLADDNYRIRLSSVELVGDLLFNLTGISSKTDADEDEDDGAAQAGQSLLEVLGEDRRNKVLSSLYICRCDTSGQVRAAAIAVWKALVATPRTLRELVPTLTQMIIIRLGSSNMEHKVIAGNALGEVIRKAGETVFAALLPLLEDGLQSSTDPDTRQGICIALREVVNAAQPETLEEHEKKLISIVRIALVDSNAQVRLAAAESFDSLQQAFGKRAVNQVLPHLLSLLREEAEADNALSALLTLLTETTRANVILPNLIPTLLTTPITSFNAKALASLARVGGSSMTRRLPIILNTLADNIVATKDDDLRADLDSAFDAVLSSVDEFDGLNTAMSVMLAMIKHDDHRRRAIAATHLANFFAKPSVDYSRYNPDLIRVLLISFDDRDADVVKSALAALTQLQAHLRKEEMESLVVSTRQVLQQVGVAGSNLPGFMLPKGILPVVQIFLQGLMNGTADQRIQAALGIADIIDRCGPDALKPFITQITGPLIRVVGERSTDVKCAILYTLNRLLEKIPASLRPFLPQLQRTFTKSIGDPSSEVLRTRATKALSTLIVLTPRVDPLIYELVTGAKSPDPGVRNAMINALQEVVTKVGTSMSDTSRESILGLIDSQQDSSDDNMTITNAKLLGGLIKVLPATSTGSLIKSRVLVQPASHPSILALNAVLLESAKVLLEGYFNETRNVLKNGMSGKSTFVQQNAVLATGKFLLRARELALEDEDAVRTLLESLAAVITPGGDIDTRRLALVVLRTVARRHDAEIKVHLDILIPPVFASVRDPVIPVKLAAEACFLELLDVTEEESRMFDDYMAKNGKSLPVGTQRAMPDYFKRVALRLGAQARERKEAEGGAGGLGLASDEVEDEREVWSVGRVNLGQDGFEQD